MFKRFYDSGWQHPGIAFLGLFPFLLAFATRQRFLLGFVALFAYEILADALFTGALNPARGLGFDSSIAIAFVILGDFRYFVVVEWALRRGSRDPGAIGPGPLSAWVVGLAFAFIVPVVSTIPQLAMPQAFPSDDPYGLHRIFILYELLFLGLALVLRFVVLPRRLRGADPSVASWVLKLTMFEIAQYALWSGADAFILATHADVGYLFRVVPNALYYALFVPFVWWTAPASVREGKLAQTA
ncbi:MAG: hypothetical protein HOW73_47380 [Polyangiaceae bacterium]|nr:hypothetical protein [Polyangiaceae bacterium]